MLRSPAANGSLHYNGNAVNTVEVRKRDLLSISNLNREELAWLLALATEIKDGRTTPNLSGK